MTTPRVVRDDCCFDQKLPDSALESITGGTHVKKFIEDTFNFAGDQLKSSVDLLGALGGEGLGSLFNDDALEAGGYADWDKAVASGEDARKISGGDEGAAVLGTILALGGGVLAGGAAGTALGFAGEAAGALGKSVVGSATDGLTRCSELLRSTVDLNNDDIDINSDASSDVAQAGTSIADLNEEANLLAYNANVPTEHEIQYELYKKNTDLQERVRAYAASTHILDKMDRQGLERLTQEMNQDSKGGQAGSEQLEKIRQYLKDTGSGPGTDADWAKLVDRILTDTDGSLKAKIGLPDDYSKGLLAAKLQTEMFYFGIKDLEAEEMGSAVVDPHGGGGGDDALSDAIDQDQNQDQHPVDPEQYIKETTNGTELGEYQYTKTMMNSAGNHLVTEETFQVRSFDVAKLDALNDDRLIGGQALSKHEANQVYGDQLNALEQSGQITGTERTELLKSLRHIDESVPWSAARFTFEDGKSVSLTQPDMYNYSIEYLSRTEQIHVAAWLNGSIDHLSDPATLRERLAPAAQSAMDTGQQIKEAIGYSLGTTTKIGAISGTLLTAGTEFGLSAFEPKKNDGGDDDSGHPGSSGDMATSQADLPGLTSNETTLAEVTATHEAFLQSLNPKNATKTLDTVREIAKAELASATGDKPSLQAEMYKVMSQVAAGTLPAKGEQLPADFVTTFQEERAKALESIEQQVGEANQQALKNTLDDAPKWKAELAAQGHGANADAQALDAINRMLHGDPDVKMNAKFMTKFVSERQELFKEMPEASLIAAGGIGEQVPVGIGLTPKSLASASQILSLIQEQDASFEKLSIDGPKQEAILQQIDREALAQAEKAGIPDSLQKVLNENKKNGEATAVVMALVTNGAIAGDLDAKFVAEQEQFLSNYLKFRDTLLNEQVAKQ